MLTAETLRRVLNYNPDTGLLTWRESRGRVAAGQVAGSLRKRDGVVRVRVNGRFYGAHRLAWLWVNGRWPGNELDHINGIPSDNRIANLRDCGRTINRQNMRRAHHDSASKTLGVSWSASSRKWRARIWAGGKEVGLGIFDTTEQAHKAYLTAKRRLHPGCTI